KSIELTKLNPMENSTGGLIHAVLGLPVFHSEWVLWFLFALSLTSIAVVLERWVFFRRHRVDADALRRELTRQLERGDFQAAAAVLARHDALETNVALEGLKAYDKGPESVEDLVAGALGRERVRYEGRLNFLATVASNAPYIGLLGTVLGIVRAFRDLG